MLWDAIRLDYAAWVSNCSHIEVDEKIIDECYYNL